MATLEEDSVFTCSICLEQFTNPKYLPCLHTFCELCITSFIASAISDCEVKQEKKRFLCPVCRSENYPPVKNITAEEWAKNLPKNHQLQSIANTLLGKSILKPVFCESCRNNHEEKIATLRCKQCQNNLCETCCTFIHKRVKGFLLHTIVDLRKSDFHNDLLGGEGLCSDHPDKEITVYCSDHEKLCCTFCLTAKHSDCENLLSLDEIEQEDVKLYTETLNGETQKMREISKTALHEIRDNIKSLHLEKDKILSNAAKFIQRIKDGLDLAYQQLENPLLCAHRNTISKLTMSLDTLKLFDETLSQATKFATAVIHNGSKKQMFVVLTKLHERISSQFKNLTEQRNDLKLAQLKWNCVDTIENFANLPNLGDFEYVFQPNDWSTEIDRHINNITKDANPKELVCGELKMKEIIPRRILAGLSTETSKPVPPVFTASQFNRNDVAKLLGRVSVPNTEPENRKIQPMEVISSPMKITETQLDQSKEKSNVKPTMSLSPSVTKVREYSVPGIDSAWHVSVDKLDRLWVSDKMGIIVQTDLKGNQLTKIHSSGADEGYHTVTLDENLIYTDNRKKVIFEITPNRGTNEFKKTGDWTPCSIHSSRFNRDILVGMYKDREAKVTRYSKTGTEIQNIQRDNQGQEMYDYPHYITENINGNICTSDHNKQAVVVVNKSGQYRFSYKNQDSKFIPYGICTDVLGHILVCDRYSETVRLLDQDGGFLSIILSEQQGIKYPRGVCVDAENNLYVGQYCTNTVKVYKYLQ